MKNIGRPLELLLRHAVVYPILRILFRNPQQPKKINIKHVRKVLILRYDRIGDIIVTTPVFRALRKANPDMTIGVLCSTSNAELVRHNSSVDRVHILSSNWWQLVREVYSARREHYDVVLNFIFNRTTTGGILANLIAPRGIKIGQGAEKYRFYFNRLLQLPRADRHMTEILAFFLSESFGLKMKRSDMRMEIAIDEDSATAVSEFLGSHSIGCRSSRSRKVGSYCVLNVSAVDAVRKMSHAQANAIGRFLTTGLKWNTVVISSPAEKDSRNRIVTDIGSAKCFAFPSRGRGNLREIAALIRESAFVVTPDTSIVHFASALGIPVFGLFTRLQQIAVEWLPYRVRNKIVFAPEGQPLSSINEKLIVKELKNFVNTLKNSRTVKHR